MVSGSTPDEMFRATLRIRTLDGEFATLIVTRQGLGRAGRTWVTFAGAIKTTAVMDPHETEGFVELLGKSMSAQ